MSATNGETVKVVAPSTLAEGYTFDATVNGEVIKVSVPPGGVKEGEMFDAPIVTAVVDQGALSTPLLDAASKDVAAAGAWRHGLFSCFDTCANGMFWMTCCCPLIAIGQLLQRLKMNFMGQPNGSYKNTCMVWTVLMIVVIAVQSIDVALNYEKNASSDSTYTSVELSASDYIFEIIYLIVSIFALAALTRARFFMREKWSIPADCCEGFGCLSDCCCAYWCGCCATIQMMRHTHDEKQDGYGCGSKTGLSDDAADVV